MALAPMLNAAGRIIGDLSITALAPDRYLIVGSGFAEAFHMRWFADSAPPADVFVRAASSTLTGFSIAGPRARDLLRRLTRIDVSAERFRFFDVRETAVGMSPAILTRSGFTGELGYEVWVTPDFQAQLYDDLLDAGRDLGLVHFGGRALSSLRLEKAYGSFQKDFRPDYTPAETGLDRFVDFDKPAFTGREAVLAERARGPKRRFVILEVDADDADVVGYESVLHDGKPVGYVTSGGYGHFVGKSIAAGYVPTALARDGERFEIDILGRACTAILREKPLHDPAGARLRG
jgi:dimethylglycine dehydrogenase